MDTNPWEGKSHRREIKTGYWEGVTVSCRRRNTGSCINQHNITSTDPKEGDTGSHRRRYKAANTYPWEDPWESDSNPLNQEGHWEGNTVYFRRWNKRFQEEENRELYPENKECYRQCRQSQEEQISHKTI